MEDGSRLKKAPERPLVAIVTPVYNGAKWLDRAALASMRAQTYRPLVHIILDNASTDGTTEIIAKYVQEVDFPVIVRRNLETLSQGKNFNAAVALVPPEAAYFATLCADDEMTPDALTEMMALAERRDDLVLIGGEESVNGTPRPSFLPPGVAIFDAANMTARILDDDARPPFPHVLIGRDFLRHGEDLFEEDMTARDTELALRVLAAGGSFGFVHKLLFNNAHHPGTVTHATNKQTPYLWEWLGFIEHYGPSVLTNASYRRVHRRHLRIIRRRLLYWIFTGAWTNVRREVPRLRERNISLSLLGFADALASWPAHLLDIHVLKPSAAFPWPFDAYQRGGDRKARVSQY